MTQIRARDLYEWCSIPAQELSGHPRLKVPFRMLRDSTEMGKLMSQELVDIIARNNQKGVPTRVIAPCGPKCWYAPFTELVNRQGTSLRNLTVFHMDECLDWQGQPLPTKHPYNFRTFMEEHFYGGIRVELGVPESQRFWLLPSTIDNVREALWSAPIDLTLGGWGQDGHIAYNQARRHPYGAITIEELEASSIRIQENNLDTILALAQRTFGAAYQFVPPMRSTKDKTSRLKLEWEPWWAPSSRGQTTDQNSKSWNSRRVSRNIGRSGLTCTTQRCFPKASF